MRHIRVFIASPSDVEFERARLDRVHYARDLAISLDELGVFYDGLKKPEWALAFYGWELELRQSLASQNQPALARLRSTVEALKAKLGDSAEATSLLRSVRQGAFEASAAMRAARDDCSACWSKLVAEIRRDGVDGRPHLLLAKAEP